MLEELGLSYTHKAVDIRQGTPEDIAELKALNPRAKIPALQDGSLVLAESAAILTYLADNYGGGTLIPAPRTPERATHDMWMFYRALPCIGGHHPCCFDTCC
jgi:glutathione S-transferase